MPHRKPRATSDMNSNEHTPGTLTDPILLSKIDKLFACGVGEYIALPQLVVVGDQSSGKSSVLEGLTNLPFPRDSGLCTRFAAQIIFQRSQESNISVSVIPAPGASQEHMEATKKWKKTNLKTLDPASFSEIMKEVCPPMQKVRCPLIVAGPYGHGAGRTTKRCRPSNFLRRRSETGSQLSRPIKLLRRRRSGHIQENNRRSHY